VAVSNRRALASLGRAGHPLADRLAEALHRGLTQRSSRAEHGWIIRIEALRQRMEASTEPLRTYEWEWSGDRSDERVVEEQLGKITRLASKGPMPAAILFSLVRAFEPQGAVELGTCVGISCAYQAAALRLNGSGRLWTFDASRARAATARRVLEELDLESITTIITGRFQETLEPTLRSVDVPIGYAFVDGHHDERATWQYFEQLLPRATRDTVFVFDDIHWSEGMERAWTRIAEDERVAVAVDVGDMGICLLGGDKSSHVTLRLP
jgi:predicted O-methyltransferase YrrM